MKPFKILAVVGARPNFIKIAPLHRALRQYPQFELTLVHTGQHHDAQMSAIFFEQLELPKPDHYLGIDSGTHARQTAWIMLALEPVLETEQPDLVLVVGDVNSTLAAALVAAKRNIPVAHVEAGLRSGDRQMPEEINRILTDALSDLLFVTEASGLENLQKEGIASEKVFFTGNCMIDALVFYQNKGKPLRLLEQLGLTPGNYLLLTLHRPTNVDTAEGLLQILHILERLTPRITVVFPLHPRTWQSIQNHGFAERFKAVQNLQLLDAQGYLEFQQLLRNAKLVLTDSGGIQEESTYLQVPCLTLRTTTERPVTTSMGSNELLESFEIEEIMKKVEQILEGHWKQTQIPELWDGKASERIAGIIDQYSKSARASQ